MGYWSGVACWGLLLATTMTTAFWLEARSPGAVMRWEWLRLGGLGVLLLLSLDMGVDVILLGVAYLGANLLFLVFMHRTVPPVSQDESTVIPYQVG